MVLSGIFLLLSSIIAPWWVMLLTVPLAAYNLHSHKRRDHKLHFITKREYKKDFKRLEKAFIIKSVVYGLLLAVSLVYTIMALCDWISYVSGRVTRSKYRG